MTAGHGRTSVSQPAVSQLHSNKTLCEQNTFLPSVQVILICNIISLVPKCQSGVGGLHTLSVRALWHLHTLSVRALSRYKNHVLINHLPMGWWGGGSINKCCFTQSHFTSFPTGACVFLLFFQIHFQAPLALHTALLSCDSARVGRVELTHLRPVSVSVSKHSSSLYHPQHYLPTTLPRQYCRPSNTALPLTLPSV